MATVPSPKTWTAGSTVTAAELNAELRDAIDFLVGPPFSVMRQTGAQEIPDDVETALTWHVVDQNRDGGWASGAPTRYTAQTTGWYELTASVGLEADTSGFRYISFLVNDDFNVSGTRTGPPSSGIWVGTAAATIHLDAAEFVEVTVHHSGGVALDTAFGATRFTVKWATT